MAIKNRRGVYTDFNPTNMVEGEFAIVQSGDPTAESGEAVYICFTTGSAKRLASYADVIRNIAPEYSEQETYPINTFIIYNGILYRNTSAITTPESWHSNKWKRVYIGGQPIVLGSAKNAELFNDVATNTAAGISSHAEGGNTTATGNYSHAEGYSTEASQSYSHAEGYSTHATGIRSHAEGYMSTASERTSHAEGHNTKAMGDYGSHSEGYLTQASGAASHAEGHNTKATGSYSHAEGEGTTASGIRSHAEGGETTASGPYSHSEGYRTVASGNEAHAQGIYTRATHRSQHVFGEYNVLDESAAAATARGTYVEIVGNGTTSDARSNARTLDWNGNEVLAGKLTVGASPVDDMDVATKAYVDSVGSSIAVSYTDPNNDGNIVISMGGL